MDGGGHHGGGGRYHGGRGYRGGGGRYHRGGRRGGRGRGRGYRHQPYNNRSRGPPRHHQGGGGGGGGRSSNRFGAGSGNNNQDPHTMMIRQISSFVSRVGEFKNLKSDVPQIRPVVATTANNINDLTAVLCSEDKLEMLLKFRDNTTPPMGGGGGGGGSSSADVLVKLDENVGKLVHVVIGCAAGLPLQTPSYAALTVAVHEHVKGTQYEGFAQRCVQYAMSNIARDLDTILLVGNQQDQNNTAQAWCRAKLLLRYLAILGRIGVVKGYEEDGGGVVDPSSSTENKTRTVMGLLCQFVEAATTTSSSSGERSKEVGGASHVLVGLVLSTLPYIMDYVPLSAINEKLVQPIEVLFETYKSSYSPGIGISAILLKDEQFEGEEDDDDDDDDDEEDDDDDEEDGAAGQICDSLQDLLRTSRRLVKGNEPSRFCLPIDAPWMGLSRKATPNPEGGDEVESHPISFSEEPIYLSFPQKFEAIELLLEEDSQVGLPCFELEGIVFGRLPIFGSARDPEENEDDDDEEEMEGEDQSNENLKAFTTGYTFVDRYFVAETMRDCLISHESFVSPSGVQHGNAKATAEELLSVHNVFSGENPQAGLEYAILETLFALIAQSKEEGSVRRIFLSSVLLELTRLEPSRFSPALAVGMTNLFQDYLPALVPATRDNFSRWFAYHLINTDYQWPGAFWQAWEPYALSPKNGSRGSFVRRTLHVMADNVSDLGILQDDCLGSTKSLSVELLCRKRSKIENDNADDTLSAFKAELHRRIWDNSEDPSLLRDYLMGDEVAGVLDGSNQTGWLRIDALVRTTADPVRLMGQGLENSLKDKDSEDAMADDQVLSKDAFVAMTDAVARYKETMIGILAKEAENLSSESGTDGVVVIGESFALVAVEKSCCFSANVLEGAVSCLVRNNVVSAMGVARWALADFGEQTEAEVVPRWWFFTLDAVREQLDALDHSKIDGGMIIDGAGAEQQSADNSIEILWKLLHYSIGRACTMLVALQTDEKRLNPTQVELLEGMKNLVSFGTSLLISFLSRPNANGSSRALARLEVLTRISNISELSSSTLSGLCVGYESNKGVSLLRRSLLSASCLPK